MQGKAHFTTFPAAPAALAVTLLAAALAGCASQAAADREAGPSPEQREAASKLYAGEPAVVHATEFPVASAAEGIARGDAAWRRGELDLAVYMYVQSLAYDATNPVPLQKIGAIHERRGNRAHAVKAFEMALKLDPGNAATSERLGLLYLQDGRDEPARALFERSIRADPNRWQSHNGLGIAADRRQDYAAAIVHFDAALALQPRAAIVVNNRGYSRFLAGDFAGAEVDFKAALELGGVKGTWTNLARSQARQGRYADALESFLREHEAAQAYNLLGEAVLEGGDVVAAQSYFTQAISASPRYFPAAQDNLALARARQAAPGTAPVRIARTDASVYGTEAKDAVIAVVKRGLPVSVLKTENASSLIRFRDASGATLTGWVLSASFEDSGS
jgi:tetratricopeptide (TPR) repeat protein